MNKAESIERGWENRFFINKPGYIYLLLAAVEGANTLCLVWGEYQF